jgi:hypothetical protein
MIIITLALYAIDLKESMASLVPELLSSRSGTADCTSSDLCLSPGLGNCLFPWSSAREWREKIMRLQTTLDIAPRTLVG